MSNSGLTVNLQKIYVFVIFNNVLFEARYSRDSGFFPPKVTKDVKDFEARKWRQFNRTVLIFADPVVLVDLCSKSIGARDGAPPPCPFSFIFMQFSGNIWPK